MLKLNDRSVQPEQMREQIKEAVNQLLNQHPEWVQMATQGNYVALEEAMETEFSKYEKIPYIISKTSMIDGFAHDVCKEFGEKKGQVMIYARAELMLHKNMPLSQFLQLLTKKFEEWDDVVSFYEEFKNTFWEEKNGRVISRAFLDEKIEFELDLFQSNPPMVCEPRKIIGHRNGYLKLKRSVWSSKAEAHDVFPKEFLNRQNSIPYIINYDVWESMLWNRIPTPEQEPEESDADYKKKLDEEARHHWRKGFILQLYKKLGIKKIYILNMFDYRGRNYPIGYLFNPQGTDEDKAVLSFEEEMLTEEGRYWLAISIANCMNCKYKERDLDKHTFPIAKEWYDIIIEPMLDQEKEVFKKNIISMAQEAESPACFYAQCMNMWEANNRIKQGLEPMVWSICHFDATSSGYQIQAIWAKDTEMSKLTNVLPTGDRSDLYTTLYNRLIQDGIPSKFTRSQIKKKIFVPSVYNCSRNVKELFDDPKHQKIFHDLMNKFKAWKLNRTFPLLWKKIGTRYAFVLPDGFRAFKINKVKMNYHLPFRDKEVVISRYQEGELEYSLELGPGITHSCDGFIARELSRRAGLSAKRRAWLITLANHPEFWNTEPDESCILMSQLLKYANKHHYFSYRILYEVTPANIGMLPKGLIQDMLNDLPKSTFHISEIHDSFGVSPNHAGELMKQYKLCMYSLAQSRYLQACAEDLGTHYDDIPCPKEFADGILKSEYMLR